MKDSMTGFDVRAVSLELDKWSGAYVKKAYMPHYEQLSRIHNSEPTRPY